MNMGNRSIARDAFARVRTDGPKETLERTAEKAPSTKRLLDRAAGLKQAVRNNEYVKAANPAVVDTTGTRLGVKEEISVRSVLEGTFSSPCQCISAPCDCAPVALPAPSPSPVLGNADFKAGPVDRRDEKERHQNRTDGKRFPVALVVGVVVLFLVMR